MVIYKTINLINNKFYIGKDSRNAPSYFGSGLLLLKAIEKYGKSNFKKEILQTCASLEELSVAEIFWIKELDANNRKIAYNIAEGGQGGNLGEEVNKKISVGVSKSMQHRTIEQKTETLRKFKETLSNRTPEQKQSSFNKMSIAKKGQVPWCKGTKGIVKSWNKGLLMSEETKSKMKGKVKSESHKANLSKAKLGIPSKNKKQVCQLNLEETIIIKIWNSVSEAADSLEAYRSNIKKCADNKSKFCKNYKWQYPDKVDAVLMAEYARRNNY